MEKKESLKEEMGKSSNEMKEKTNQILQDTVQTVQRLKAEIETVTKHSLRECWNEKCWGNANITYRIQQIAESNLGFEDTLVEIDESTKENLKCNKYLTQNIQEILGTMECPYLRIIDKKDCEETHLKVAEIIFNSIME